MTVQAKNSEIFIAIPNMGFLSVELVGLVMNHRNCFLYTPLGLRPTSYARNDCAKRFMETDAKYLWFIDSDTTPPPEALKLLLDADKPAVSGVVNSIIKVNGENKALGMVLKRGEDGQYYPAIGTQGVHKIDASGFACILLKREVFEQVEFPWFEEKSWGESRGEDFIFCEKMAEKGIPLYAHFEVQCKHRHIAEF
jgi:hypothetical protein